MKTSVFESTYKGHDKTSEGGSMKVGAAKRTAPANVKLLSEASVTSPPLENSIIELNRNLCDWSRSKMRVNGSGQKAAVDKRIKCCD
jgi:hypothetical protein